MSLPVLLRLLPSGLLLVSLSAVAQEDPLARALHDEMQRSMQQLQLEQLGKPYFISYLVTDDEVTAASATLGSVLSSTQNRTRMLWVSVRVGDYGLDSSNFVPLQGGALLASAPTRLPLDDDYQELRRQIWLATDRSYKAALENLAGKRAALENRNRTGSVADFTRVAPAVVSDLEPPADLDLESATRRVREASALFRQAPAITGSSLRLVQVNRLRRYLNSEGSQHTVRVPSLALTIAAATEASDGRLLSDELTVFGRAARDLPSAANLSLRVRSLEEELEQLRSAPLAERYEGPVLFEGEAAGELFGRFAAQLAATPRSVTSNGPYAMLAPQATGSLVDKIGWRVLPEFLDVVDDPTLTEAEGGSLLGGYKVDEEGVVARRTLLVHQGILKTLLTSRAPVEGVPETSANLRGRGVVPSNVLVSSQKSSTREELRQQMLQLAQSQGAGYALVIRRLHGNIATLVYKLYPDGHEELVRNATLTDFNLSSFKSIVAVSRETAVYTLPLPARATQGNVFFMASLTAGAETPLVSCVIPSLLFADVAIEKPPVDSPKPMLLSSPLAAGP